MCEQREKERRRLEVALNVRTELATTHTYLIYIHDVHMMLVLLSECVYVGMYVCDMNNMAS